MARFKRVKADELVIATRQLATMVNSGMSLLRSLYVIEEQTENTKLREIFVDVRKDVEAGLSLSDALRKHPDMFNALYVAMVQAGETGGILDNTLLRVADQLEKDAALRRQIKAAMMYPSLIGGFAFVVLFALVAFLVPVFEKIFKDFGGELPAITKFTVFLSHLLIERWYVIFGGAFLIVFLFRKWKRSERGEMQWDRLKLKFPMKIGGIVQKVALARFSRTFSGLIAAGVPMLEAIDITGKTSGNKVVEKAMENVRDSVKKGGSLTAADDRGARGLPGHGHPDDRRGRRDRCPREHDVQGRRLLRGAGRDRRQGPDLNPRTDNDPLRRRNRRLHRYRDVPADVQGLRLD